MAARYGTLANVKLRLNLDGTTYDTHIEEMQEYACDYIDQKLGPYTTVPLTTVPDIINRIADDLTAAFFRQDQAEVMDFKDDKVLFFEKRAKEALQEYIEYNYTGEKMQAITYTKTESDSYSV